MELFWLGTVGAGRLAVCARPRAGHFLADDLAALRGEGVDVLVSALTPHEEHQLQLEEEGAAAASAGLEFVRLRIGNLQVPGGERDRLVLEGLHRRLGDGAAVAAHCHASVGRSPLIAVSLMVLCGWPAASAWAHVEAARGMPVPDTLEQRAWPERLIALP
jgi:protein-tyrosine phosphatase